MVYPLPNVLFTCEGFFFGKIHNKNVSYCMDAAETETHLFSDPALYELYFSLHYFLSLLRGTAHTYFLTVT